MPRPAPQINAEILGLRALSWLAGSPEDINTFLRVTGLEPEHLRARAQDLDFLIAVLDFLLRHEDRLLAFCADADIPAQTVSEAYRALSRHA